MTAARLKDVADIRVSNVDKKFIEGETQVRLCNYTDVYYNPRVTGDLAFMVATASTEQVQRFGLRRGDVVITKDSETADDIAVAARIETDAADLVCGYHLAIIRAHTANIDDRYLYWTMASTPTREFYTTAATGVTRFGLRQDSIGDLRVRLPATTEQRAIADFLDAETTRIDAITSARESQLQLLALRSRESMSRSLVDGVTDFIALRRLARIQGGLTINSARVPGDSSVERPYLRVANVQDGHIDLTDIAHVIVPSSLAARATLRPGDVLVAEGNGNPSNLGRGAVWHGEISGCLHQNHVHAIRPNGAVLDSDYLALLTRTKHARDYFASVSAQVGIATLSKQKVMDLQVPRRDIVDQRRIVQLVISEQSVVDRVGDVTRSQLRLLLEYRQALITAAVTGEIDVSTASGRGVPA